MRRNTYGLALAFLLLLSYVLVFEVKMPEANAALFNDDFGNLSNWTAINGVWSVSGGVLQGVAPSQNCMIWAGNTAWTNYQLTTYGSKLNSGNVIGIIVRYTDNNNFYWMGLGCWGHKFSISKMVDGVGTELASSGLISEVEVGRWYMISAVVVDSTLQLFVDGVKVLVVQDNSLSNGAIGFITYNGTMQAKQLVVQSLAPAPTPDPNSWSMYKNDPSRSGSSTSISPTTNQTLWTYTTGGSISSPVIADGIVYFGSDDGYFYALNAKTGAKIWNYAIGDEAGSSTPAVANGVVVFNIYNLTVALNATTGAKIWNQNGGINSPAIVGGVVYAASYDDQVYALNALTGYKIWNSTAYYNSGPVAVVDGLIYVGGDNRICALDSLTGNQIWSLEIDNPRPANAYSELSVSNGMVYIVMPDPIRGNSLYGLNASTGSIIWNTSYVGWSVNTAVYNNVLYTSTLSGGRGVPDLIVSVYNALTGSLLWSNTSRYPYTTPNSIIAISGGVMYELCRGVSNGELYALNAFSGSQIWSYTPGGSSSNYFSSAAIAGGIVYVGSNDGKLYAFGQLPTPTPSPTPSPSPTPTLSPTSAPTPSSTPTATPTSSPSPTSTPVPTSTPSPTLTLTPTPTPSPTPTLMPTPISTPTPTPTPTSTPITSPTTNPSLSPSPTPTGMPKVTSTLTVSPTPTPSPSATPTPSSSQLQSQTPSPLSQTTETPLYLYAVAVLAISAISATTLLLIRKKR
jgi:outer membrane protein assembly factor BamB